MDNPKKVRDVINAKKIILGGIFEGVTFSLVAAWFPMLYLFAIPVLFFASYKISRALEKSAAWTVLCIVSMFLPVVCVIVLLVLNSQANDYLRDQGVNVGQHRDKWMECRVNVHK